MVQIMNSKRHAVVKLEIEDSSSSLLEEVNQVDPLHKRTKLHSSFQGMDGGGGGDAEYNPLDEPSPIGLRLKKSESFLDLIQTKLSQQQQHTNKSSSVCPKDEKDQKAATTAVGNNLTHEKLKASNFPASLLQIGSWEYKSIHEGDLVGKCYFAKHKLVWEVLDGGLKNKIEIQWSDIVAIKANFPDDGLETLEVVLARQPLFFRETNPQPRKHTLWQATSDFTGGQASLHRRHFLTCQQGLLGKHFEKLIQCDPRLNFLSRQPDILLESPYFEPRVSAFSNLNESTEKLDLKPEGSIFALQDEGSPSEVPASSFHGETQGFLAKSQETSSPSSGIDAYVMEDIRSTGTDVQKFPSHWDQIKVPGIHPSMSMSDLVCHIGDYFAEQMASGDLVLPDSNMTSNDILEQITQYLLSDSDHAAASDEQFLMSRVNSLCCLLQPGATQSSQAKIHNNIDGNQDSSSRQGPSMSRKDSVGELLLNLPRIASLPHFLQNTQVDSDKQRWR